MRNKVVKKRYNYMHIYLWGWIHRRDNLIRVSYASLLLLVQNEIILWRIMILKFSFLLLTFAILAHFNQRNQHVQNLGIKWKWNPLTLMKLSSSTTSLTAEARIKAIAYDEEKKIYNWTWLGSFIVRYTA